MPDVRVTNSTIAVGRVDDPLATLCCRARTTVGSRAHHTLRVRSRRRTPSLGAKAATTISSDAVGALASYNGPVI